MVRRRSSDPSRRRKPLARDGLRAETLGWEHLARSQETGPKSSYGYTKTLKGPPPSGGQR